ncbi:MAG: hypothetical protein JNK16_04565 [Phycisphaerales bacterium]|nr:hypothetical protein [Phycisphaerales bacterium]
MPSPSPIPCLNCGYSIADLPEDAQCPECAFPIRGTRAARERLDATLSDPARAASRFALLGAFQFVAALWLCFIPLHYLASRNRAFWILSDRTMLAALCASLLLWLCIQCTWYFVARLLSATFASSSAKLLKACSGVAAIALVGGGLALLAFGRGDAQTPVLVPSGLFLLATIASLIGTVPAAMASLQVIRTFIIQVRSRLTSMNWLAILFVFVSVTSAGLAHFASPWWSLLIPLAPALSSLRSFALARQIRAAINTL